MTVSSVDNRKEFIGNDVTTSFGTSPMVFFDTSDLDVYVVVTATGVATLLVENTSYSVTGGAGSTGTVNLAGGSAPFGAPSSAQTLSIVRGMPFTQQTDFVNNDPSDAEVAEDALDRLKMEAQELLDRADRTLRQPTADLGNITTLPTVADRKSKYLSFDASGNPVASSGTTSAFVVTPFMETVLDDANAAAARNTLGLTNQRLWCGTATGTANALVLTPAVAAEALTTGLELVFKSSASANTGATTIAVSGLVVTPVQANGAALIAGNIAASKWYRVTFDGTNFQLEAVGSIYAIFQLVLAKGDWLLGTAANTLAKLTVGANDTFPIAASGETTGVKWGTVNSFTEDTAPDTNADYVVTYDTSAATSKKVLLGLATGLTLTAETATTSGTTIDFTGIPAWVKRITVLFEGVSQSSADTIGIQLGDAGDIEAAGYVSSVVNINTATPGHASATDRFLVCSTTGTGDVVSGAFTISLKDAANFTWIADGTVKRVTTGTSISAGDKSLSAALTRFRLLTAGSTFDAGSIALLLE